MYILDIVTIFLAFAMLDIAGASPQGRNGNGNGFNGDNNNGQDPNANVNNGNAANTGNNGNTGNTGNNGNAANTGNNGNNGNNNAGGGATLDAANIQQGSTSNGNPSDGQAASLTDEANFINFCSGKTITNGEQVTGGSCNGIGRCISASSCK